MVRETNERAEDVLIENDILTEAALLKALSGIYRTHFVSTEKLSKADIPRATVQMIPRRVAETLGVFPVLFDRQTSVLSIVTADPDNAEILREVKLVSGAKDVKAFVARPAAVNAAIKKHHTGDLRAFEMLERNPAFDFGQQMMADGRVVAKKDSVRRNGQSDPDIDLNAQIARKPPSIRRQASQPDPEEMGPAPAVRARAQSSPDLEMPQRASRT